MAVSIEMEFSAKVGPLRMALAAPLDIATKGIIKTHKDANHITFQSKDDKVIVRANGGRMSCEVEIGDMNVTDLTFKSETEGKATFSAVDFARCLESFSDSDIVVFAATESELKITKSDDKEVFQVLPIAKDLEVTIPKLATKYQKDIKIDRLTLLDGLKNVGWGAAFEEHQEEYYYVRLTVNETSSEFVAGTGGRFVVWSMSGPAVSSAKDKTEFLLHKDQIPVISAILSKVSDTVVKVRQANQDGNAPAQIVVEADYFKVVIVGFNTDIKYAPVDGILKAKRPYAIETKIEDWGLVSKGLLATFNAEFKQAFDAHESDIEPRITKNYIMFTSKGNMKAQRKVPIISVKRKGDKEDGLEFRCSTMYLGEISSKYSKEDVISFEYTDDENGLVYVVGPEKTNSSRGTTEQMIIFMASIKE